MLRLRGQDAKSVSSVHFRRCHLLRRISLPASAWEHWGGDRGGSRFSPLNQITPDNVGNLVRAWEFRTGDLDARAPEVMKRTKFQATPLLVEDSLIFCSPFNEVIALDPGSGAPKWRYDPKISTAQRPANRYNCRGVAYWVDDKATGTAACRARIFMGTNDARVIALDARTGIPCADFGANGEIKIDDRHAAGMARRIPDHVGSRDCPRRRHRRFCDRGQPPRRGATRQGARLRCANRAARWSFDPLVHDGVVPATPMSGRRCRWTRSAAWCSCRRLRRARISGRPAARQQRLRQFGRGVARRDRRRVWSYQTVHHDVWDYDLPAQPTLARIDTGEGPRDVVIQPTKQGFVFVLDRDTGKPVWPVEERAVPQGGAEGEQLSPTQPFPTHVPPLLSQQISADDVFGLIPFWERGACRAQVASARNEGLYTPPSTQGTVVFPMTGGGVNWGGAAFDPVNQILYANTSRAIHIVKLLPRAAVADGFNPPPGHDFGRQQGAPFAMTRAVALSPLGLLCNKRPWGEMVAVDLKAGKILAFAGGHHRRPRAARHRLSLGHAARQWRRDHRRRSRLHRRAGCLSARLRRAIGAGAVAGPAAGAGRRQSHDVSVEGRAICRDRRRRSFGVGHDHRRQRGGVPPGAAGRSALAVVAHHRPARWALHERGDRGRVHGRADGGVAAGAGGGAGWGGRERAQPPLSSSGLTETIQYAAACRFNH